MLRPRMILVISVGLLMTLASIVLRYQVAHQPIEPIQTIQPIEESPEIAVQPLQTLPAVNHDEGSIQTIEPDINKSDLGNEVVRALAAELSSHPKFAVWLVTDDLMRRFVQSVNLIAGGYSPRDELRFLDPQQPFVVDREGEDLVITKGSFNRYNLVTDVFESISTRSAVLVYEQLAPKAQETHQEISWYAPEFDVRLSEALDHLIETPIPTTNIRVERGVISYAFADPSLEDLTPAQKQLLRMGPRNALRIQKKLIEFKNALGLDSLAPEQIASDLHPQEQDQKEPKPENYKIAQIYDGMTPAP